MLRPGSSRTAWSSCRSRTCSSPDCSSPRSGTRSASGRPPVCSSNSACPSRWIGAACSSCSTTSSRSSSAAPIIVRLYSIAPDAAFLVTSRAVLRVRGEQVYDVEPLATEDPASPDSLSRARTAPAVELFVERASAANPLFELTDANLAAVVGICRALDGVPLAIELAAARARLLTPADILRRLDRQLALLVDSSRDLPERQRTLRSTIEWSAGLLDDDARRLLRELAVFAPGFTLDSVEALGARRGWSFDVFSALESLVDSSLVDQSDVDGEPSFSLLVSVREYGVELLAAAGEEDAVRDAHAAVYTAVARIRRSTSARGTSSRPSPACGSSAGTCAPPSGTWSRAPTRRPRAMSRGACSSSGGSAATSWRSRCGWRSMLDRADGAASPRVRAIVGFYSGWRDAWTTHRPGIATILLEAASGVRTRGRPARRRDGHDDGGGRRDQQRGARRRGGHRLAARRRRGVPRGGLGLGRVPGRRRDRAHRAPSGQGRRGDRDVPSRRRCLSGLRRAVRGRPSPCTTWGG